MLEERIKRVKEYEDQVQKQKEQAAAFLENEQKKTEPLQTK